MSQKGIMVWGTKVNTELFNLYFEEYVGWMPELEDVKLKQIATLL